MGHTDRQLYASNPIRQCEDLWEGYQGNNSAMDSPAQTGKVQKMRGRGSSGGEGPQKPRYALVKDLGNIQGIGWDFDLNLKGFIK